MDSAVISANKLDASLVDIKFTKVRAEIGSKENVLGGTLTVGTDTKISKGGKSNQAIGVVTYTVLAHPKGKSDKDSFAFRIALTVEGVYEWSIKEPNIEDRSVTNALLQSLYVMATSEVISLARKMGFPNVQLPLDIKINQTLATKAGLASAATAKAKKPATAKAKKPATVKA